MLPKHIIPVLFISFVVLVNIRLSAQDMLKITILNKETQEPVPYATVMFPQLQYGFSANGNGLFVLPVNRVEHKQEIVITSIGYERYSSLLGALINNNVDTIFLKPKVTILDEILVKAEAPLDIVESTIKNLNVFLGKDPYYLSAFYQESITKNNQYTGFSEAYGLLHISGYQPGYNRKNRLFSYDLAQWKNLRRTNYILPDECNSKKKKALSIDKMMKAKSEYLYNGPLIKSNRSQFRYTIDSVTNFDSNDVFVINFTPRQVPSELYSGRVYIKADDYALIAMEVEQVNTKALYYQECNVSKYSSKFQMTFTKIGQKYYLNTVNLINRYLWNNEEVIENLTLRGEEFKDTRVNRLNYDQRLVVYNEMINPQTVYDSSFWAQNGEALPDQINKDLGQKMSPSEQFFFNSEKRYIPLPDDFNNYEELYQNKNIFRLFSDTDF